MRQRELGYSSACQLHGQQTAAAGPCTRLFYTQKQAGTSACTAVTISIHVSSRQHSLLGAAGAEAAAGCCTCCGTKVGEGS